MKNITILGAGLSATSLINYLLDKAEENDWFIRIGDFNLNLAQQKLGENKNGEAFLFDVNKQEEVVNAVQSADIVVSMLPARFHLIIAQECVKQAKNMLTASYISKEMKELEPEAKKAGVGIYNELGVDPGIDHMSAMEVIDSIRNNGGKMLAFYSSTGGLVAPAYDNNPWNYKFTWNPRNVVLAGQGVSKFIRDGKYKYIPYTQLFKRLITTSVEGYGDFEIYPNRDSLSYRETYGLQDIPTIFRGTMRRPGYAKAWDVFVQLGATDDTYIIEDSENMTYREFINIFLKYMENVPVEEKLFQQFPHLVDEEVMQKLHFLDIFSNKKVGLKDATPAQILQKILVDKWQLEPNDKDMIVMQHRFGYLDAKGEKHEKLSSLVVEGDTQEITAMAKTVGIPLAIATKLVATNQLQKTGVIAPVTEDVYKPILAELKSLGIVFQEKDIY